MPGEHLFAKILLIEDNRSHSLLIKRAIEGLVGEVLEADNFAAGKELLRNSIKDKNPPELIISDLNLPDGTGSLEVAEFKKIDPQIPVIVLTVSKSLNDAVEAMKNGAIDFLVKDFSEDFSQVIGLSLSKIKSSLELKKEQLRLRRQMETLRGAIEKGDDALAIVDGEGKVIYSNASYKTFARLYGSGVSSLYELVNQGISGAENLRKSLLDNLRNLPLGSVWRTEMSIKSDKDMAFQISLSVIGGNYGDRECVVWIRDISEEKRREKFQREILSTTTHDLKGPLGAILISAELVAGLVKENTKASELVLRIASSASSAVNLIDEFLSARRIQEGTFILRPYEHNLKRLFEDALSSYEMIAAARNISMRMDCPDDDLKLSVDKSGLNRVLGNLLSNALKFTPEGGEVVLAASAEDHEVVIRVSDTGTGMESAEVSRIFDRFSRLEKHRDVSGSGLGLFVVKSIVNAHGGTIEVTSKPEQGTSFSIRLPLKPPINDRGELICLDFG
jgi:signal transduction histidine kinase/FixJ family two-component response regulator